MYVCMYIYIHMYTYIHIYIYMYIYTHELIYVRMYTLKALHLLREVSTQICECLVYVQWMWIHAYNHMHAHIHTNIKYIHAGWPQILLEKIREIHHQLARVKLELYMYVCEQKQSLLHAVVIYLVWICVYMYVHVWFWLSNIRFKNVISCKNVILFLFFFGSHVVGWFINCVCVWSTVLVNCVRMVFFLLLIE
jgi:hypothetical protein